MQLLFCHTGTIKDLFLEASKADVSIYLHLTGFSEDSSWPGHTGPILDPSPTLIALIGFLSINWESALNQFSLFNVSKPRIQAARGPETFFSVYFYSSHLDLSDDLLTEWKVLKKKIKIPCFSSLLYWCKLSDFYWVVSNLQLSNY